MRKTVLAVLPIVVLLLPSGSFARDAGECLAAPKGASPRGSHWYYRLDRATHRKCWYLGAQGRNTNPTFAHVPADQSREAPPIAAAPAAPAAATPLVRQTESEQLGETTTADTLPREMLAPAPLFPLKSRAVTAAAAPAPTSETDTSSALDAPDAAPAATPDPAPVEAAVAGQPAGAPAEDSPTHWSTLILLMVGVLGVAGFVGRAALRHPDAQRLDQYARPAQPLVAVLRTWTDSRARVSPTTAMSPPSPVPYMRAPNLAWLADEQIRHPDDLRWPEVQAGAHAKSWPEPNLRRAAAG